MPHPTPPALPVQGSNAWYPHYSGLDASVRSMLGMPPTLTRAADQTLLWDGTNGGSADAYGRQGVNSAQWTYDMGGGETPVGSGNRWGNWELQVYQNDLDHVWVKGGQLHIKATRGTYPSPVAGEVTASYASGRIHTQGKVSVPVNSYWETTIRHPEEPGTWGACWQMGDAYVRNADNTGNWPQYGEIDIEWLGAHPRTVGFALHMLATGYTPAAGATDQWQHDAYIGHETYGDTPRLNTLIGEPHTYGLWRSASEVRWYVNRKEIRRITQADATAHGSQWPFGTGGFFLILNLAVGGQLGGSDLDGREVYIGSMGAEMTVDPIGIWTSVTDPTGLGLA
jgi:hypothetical protein